MKKKKMKNILNTILILILSMFIFECNVSAKDIITTKSKVNEKIYTEKQTYIWNWAKVSSARLFAMKNGTYIRVENSDKHFIVECFDSSFKSLWAKKIKRSLSMWGDAAYDGKDFFIVTGQKNNKENNKKSVVCITRYNSKWEKTGETNVKNCFTVCPFDAGTCSVEFYDDIMYIKTGRTMYETDDGNHHQSSMTIVVDKENMKVLDHPTELYGYADENKNYGYVSHSFNQMLCIDDGNMIAVDHGDAYPREMVLNDINDDSSYTFFSIAGETGDNTTGATLGDFKISDTNYIICGTSVDQKKAEKNNKLLYTGIKNVYIATMDKKTHKVKFKFVTNFKTENTDDYTPYLTRISKNRYMLIWKYKKMLYYREIDGEGKFITKLKSKKNYELSECEPVAVNGKIIWYSAKRNKIKFYTIPYKVDTVKLTVPELITTQNKSDLNKVLWKGVKEADGYYIYRSIDGKSFQKIGEYSKKLEADEFFSYKIDNCKDYTKYIYSVSAYCIMDSTGKQIEGQYNKTGKICINLKGTKVESIENTEKGLKVTWQKSKQATGYILYKKNMNSKDNIFEKCAMISSGDINNYEDTDVEKENVYAYTIAEVFDGFEGQYSDDYIEYMRIIAPAISSCEFINNKFYVFSPESSDDLICNSLQIYRKEEDGDWEIQEKVFCSVYGQTSSYVRVKNPLEDGHVYTYKIVNEKRYDNYSSRPQEFEIKYNAPAKNVQRNKNIRENKETITWDFVVGSKKYILYAVSNNGDYICKIGEVNADTNNYVMYGKFYNNIVIMPQ